MKSPRHPQEGSIATIHASKEVRCPTGEPATFIFQVAGGFEGIHLALWFQVDLPRVLIAMNVVKDAERIGDQSKNVFDIGNAGIDLSDADDLKWLQGIRDQTSNLIAECARIYQERDEEAAHKLIPKMDVYLDEFDACIQRQMDSEGSPRQAVPRALLCRYLKRITAHLMNMLTSLVMPVHRLDYYDEKKADRPAKES